MRISVVFSMAKRRVKWRAPHDRALAIVPESDFWSMAQVEMISSRGIAANLVRHGRQKSLRMICTRDVQVDLKDDSIILTRSASRDSSFPVCRFFSPRMMRILAAKWRSRY